MRKTRKTSLIREVATPLNEAFKGNVREAKQGLGVCALFNLADRNNLVDLFTIGAINGIKAPFEGACDLIGRAALKTKPVVDPVFRTLGFS